MTAKFRHNPTEKQFQALEYWYDRETDFILFGGGAGGGKSWIGCEALLANSLTFPETNYFIGRKTLKNLKKTTLRTFQKVCRHHGIGNAYWKYNDQYSCIQFHNGSIIDLLELKYQPSDPMFEDLGSAEYTSGFMEEAGEINFKAFDVLKSRIGRANNDKYGINGKIFITCNPKKNWLYRTFYKPSVTGQLPPNYKFIQSLYNDNPYAEKEYNHQLSQITDNVTRQRLKYGIWEYDDDDNALMPFDAIQDIFTNYFVPSGDPYMTIDVALHGSDIFRLGIWSGWRLTHLYEMEKCDADQAEEFIKVRAEYHHVPRRNIAYDADGLGSFLRGYLRGAKPVVNNAAPVKVKGQVENYQNLQTQLVYRFADRVNASGVFVSADEQEKEMITEELQQCKKKDPDSDGKKKILDKQTVKENIGRSPDFRDMMILREYLDLVPKGKMTVA